MALWVTGSPCAPITHEEYSLLNNHCFRDIPVEYFTRRVITRPAFVETTRKRKQRRPFVIWPQSKCTHEKTVTSVRENITLSILRQYADVGSVCCDLEITLLSKVELGSTWTVDCVGLAGHDTVLTIQWGLYYSWTWDQSIINMESVRNFSGTSIMKLHVTWRWAKKVQDFLYSQVSQWTMNNLACYLLLPKNQWSSTMEWRQYG